jgi:subtilisin family serine protease
LSPQAGIDTPAWSEPFVVREKLEPCHQSPFEYDRERAWGGATGEGVTVAVIDSGIDAAHPAVGHVARSVSIERVGDAFEVNETAEPGDFVGHGTACAGIIRSFAPKASLVSVRVLGPNNRANGRAFLKALEWITEQRIDVVNLSLSSRSDELFPYFHDIVDEAYFNGCLLISAASNTPGEASYPSLFSSVVSVASHDIPDPWTYFYNPNPPVEFGAWGVDVPVAWLGGGQIVASGNSFAAPHIAGLAALVRSKHPGLTAFELKSVLSAVATPAAGGVDGAASEAPAGLAERSRAE